MSFRRLPPVLTAIALLGSCATRPDAAPAALVPAYSAVLAATAEPATYPYVAEHGRGNRRLGFVAALHTPDRDSATQRSVREAFARLRPRTVIIEGVPTAMGVNPPAIVEMARSTDEPDAGAYARGEAGYAASLALKAGVPFIGGEPSAAELTAALGRQGHSALDVLYTDLLAILPQSIRGGEISGPDDPDFFDVFARWTVSLSVERGNAPRVSLEGFSDWYRAQFGADYRTDPLFMARADPGQDTLPGRILRAQSLLRDRHLLDLILRTVRERGRVLVVYGGTHRTTLAQALAAELGPATVWSVQASAEPAPAGAAGFAAPR